MIVTTDVEIENFKKAGKLAGEVLEATSKLVKVGISTGELDEFAEKMIRDAGCIPTFKGYRKFPATICVSINEEVVHGIPNRNRVLKDGDVISIDLGATFRVENGKKMDYIGDTALTVAVGEINPRLQKLLDDTQKSLYAGIKVCRAGATLDDIGGAIEDIAKENLYGIVRDYGGHGIGPNYHEDPLIFNYRTGSKVRLKPGMVIAIEPMFNQGGDRVRLKQDGWTVVTQDYKPSAHFEHSILVTEGEPIVLTQRPSEVI
ncbi:MAG: type I methionyl aminopeptidase [Candidatus Melainabacteria bacterium]|jgi:methionyl aminopeptidase|nr:MAG: type I methionyl aminopeptidase [Candidatus Melainabacteria bacterium]